MKEIYYLEVYSFFTLPTTTLALDLSSLLEPPLHRHVVLLQLLDLLDRLAIRDHKSLTPETMSLAALDWLQIQLILLLNEVFLISALDSQL